MSSCKSDGKSWVSVSSSRAELKILSSNLMSMLFFLSDLIFKRTMGIKGPFSDK